MGLHFGGRAVSRVTVRVGLVGSIAFLAAALPAAQPKPNPEPDTTAETTPPSGPHSDPEPKITAETATKSEPRTDTEPRTEAGTEADKKTKWKTLRGTVAAVADGDTVTLLVGKHKHAVRLAGIDAPELGQAFADKAKETLAAMLTDKTVNVLVLGEDEDNRILGVLYTDQQCVNTVMVGDGWAWYDVRQVDSRTLLKAQEQARKERRGLWAETDPTPPWQWRKSRPAPAGKEATFMLREAPAVLRPPPSVLPPPGSASPPQRRATSTSGYWLNTSTNVRHNRTCPYYGKTKNGRPCGPNEGKPCKTCGG